MKSLRERNNLASKLSNQKALEKKYAQDYEYEVIKVHSMQPDTEVYHWSNAPEEWLYQAGYITDYNKHRYERLMAKKEEKEGINRLKDYGADGISRRKDELGNYIYDLIQAKYYISRQITGNDIGTFLATTINLMIRDKLSKGFLYTTSPLQIDLADCVANPAYPIRHILHLWKHPDGRYSKKTDEISKECDLPLRDYQKYILKRLHKKGINALSIPCRMGKTIILGHHLHSIKPERVILLAPLKISVHNLKNRLTSFVPYHKSLLVDSDKDGTTNYEEVVEFLKTNIKSVIYSTFDSALNILSKIYEEYPELLKDSFIGVDEVHNINEEVCDFINKFKNGIILSATIPEEIIENLHIKEKIYISLSDGIRDKWITDYNIWLPYLTKKDNNSTIVEVDIPIDFQKYDNNLTTKVMYLATVMLQTGSRRCISYLSSQEECDRFMIIVRNIFEKYHGLDVWTNKIDSTVSQLKREEIIEDFQHGHPDTTFHILTSVRILDEAVDIPRCDSEFITQVGEKSSDIRMLQRAQRGSTLDSKNPSKINNIILWADGWEKCVNSLELLKESDPEFHKKLNISHINYDKLSSKSVKEITKLQTIELRNWSQIRCVSPWERKRLEWEKFYKENGRSPFQKSINIIERSISQWQSNQRMYYKNKKNYMTQERITALENTEGWQWEDTDNWELIRQEWIKFYNNNQIYPSQHSKNIEEKKVGQWQEDQRKKYKNNNIIKERITILNDTIGWKWNENDKWELTRQKWELFFKKNNKNPLKQSINPLEKYLGLWQCNQRKLYRNKKDCMTQKRINALNNTPGWQWEEDDNWVLIREEWKNFFRENKRNPSPRSEVSKEKKLAYWQSAQRNNFKNNNMIEERIRSLEDTEGWEWEEKDNWELIRQKWERFFRENKRNPSSHSKKSSEKHLGLWQTTQRKYFKNKEKYMTHERIKSLEDTEGWKWK
jgi:superfamily II DNA or RNA helicase